MADDALLALQLLGNDLAQAGHAQPRRLVREADGRLGWELPLTGPSVFACDTGFVAPASTGDMVCAAAGASAALEVRYQADAYNTIPLAGTTRPGDCLGAGLNATDGVYLTANRWYVASSQGRSELRCASRLGNPGQPLVDNVEAMALWLGEAAVEGGPPVREVSASQVSDFGRVTHLRLCLLMRSTEAVLLADGALPYVDCQGRSQASPDGRLRQAFHASFALRSRQGG